MSLSKLIVQFFSYYLLVLLGLTLFSVLFGLEKGAYDPLMVQIFVLYFILKYAIIKFCDENKRALTKREKYIFIISSSLMIMMVQIVIYMINHNSSENIINSFFSGILLGYLIIFYLIIYFSVIYINQDYEYFVCPECNKEFILKESKDGYCKECKDIPLIRKKII